MCAEMGALIYINARQKCERRRRIVCGCNYYIYKRYGGERGEGRPKATHQHRLGPIPL